jgi:glycosyltransferase involved in cell wall biosynthesis
MTKPKLSIIIPAYNEEKNIYHTIDNIVHCHDQLGYDYEVIVVVDGSSDRTEKEACRHRSKNVKVFAYKKNHGKGYALKYGTTKASGEIVTFTDAGGDFEPKQFDKFIKVLEAFDADLVIGSKRHPASRVNYPLKRRILSWGYHKLVDTIFGLHVTDTQTGLKVIKASVAKKIMPRVMVKRYAFDLEMLVVANQLGYQRIFEAPVELNFNQTTTGVGVSAVWRMFLDTLAIFYRAKLLNYYRRTDRKSAEKIGLEPQTQTINK